VLEYSIRPGNVETVIPKREALARCIAKWLSIVVGNSGGIVYAGVVCYDVLKCSTPRSYLHTACAGETICI